MTESSAEIPKGQRIGSFLAGLLIVIILAAISVWASQLKFSAKYGLEFVLWAIFFGLLVRNTVGVPEKLRGAFKTELFIKIGLVLLGLTILFGDLLAYGWRGMAQALIVVITVFYFAYWVARKFGIDQKFAHIIATAVSICGVSAAIATAGAIKGDRKQLTYVISMVVLVAIPMLIGLPLVGRIFGLQEAFMGAWIGGTIDTTPAVVAAGAYYGETAVKVAAIVKMSQNVLIGVVAFILACYYALRVERKPEEKPSLKEIWYRFPKFIVGFMAMSVIASIGAATIPSLMKGWIATADVFRKWFFAFAFVSIGLETPLTEYKKMGGKAFYSFVLAQAFNIMFTAILAFFLFGVLAA